MHTARPPDCCCPRPLLLIVEGIHAVEYLSRISHILHRDDPIIPVLADLESSGRLIVIPTGGDVVRWSSRLAPLHCAEWHLYSRGSGVVEAEREQLVAAINTRPACRAVLTSRPTIEHYVHPLAIQAATGIMPIAADETDVAESVAEIMLMQRCGRSWAELSLRSRRRWRDRARAIICTVAVEYMTPSLLRECDPADEVVGWLRTIGSLASVTPQ